MNRYEEGLKIIEKMCGGGKDNIISLATITTQPNADGKPRPCVRDVDAYYEDGVFYVTTWMSTTKMQQTAQNNEVAFSACFEGFCGNGTAENLGWVSDPKNAELKAKLRKVFANWYDAANDDSNENCVILAIHITSGSIMQDHGAVRYNMDFVNKTEGEENKVL